MTTQPKRFVRAPSLGEYERMTLALRVATAEDVYRATEAQRAHRAVVSRVMDHATRDAAETILATLLPEPPLVIARRHAAIETELTTRQIRARSAA